MTVAGELGSHDADSRHRLNHERCLWALQETDFEGLGKALDGWPLDGGDPFWAVRKAALMWEGDHDREDVLPLLRSTVAALRRPQGARAGISGLSREAWASYLAMTLESTSWGGGGGSAPNRARARELSRFSCDPESEIGALSNAVERHAGADGEKGPEFDLGGGKSTRTLRFTASDIPSPEAQRARVAYRLVRLAEVAGLPSLSDRWPPTSHMLGRASEAFYAHGEMELGLRLMLRIAQSGGDELLKTLMSRRNLAVLPEDVVQSLAKACERTIGHFRTRGLGGPATRGVIAARERVGVAMECLSRLVLRMRLDQAAGVMRLALSCYATRAFYEEVLLRGEIRDLLTRSWEALTDGERTDFALEVLNSPIAGFDGFSPNAFGFMDPGELLDGQDVSLPCRDSSSEAEWTGTVRFLVRALGGDEEAGARAMVRLVQVARAGRLSSTEEEAVGRAIWRERDEAADGPIGGEKLRSWVYLCMPQSEPDMAADWFRRKWMSRGDTQAGKDGELLDQSLYAIGDAKERSDSQGFAFDLSREDEIFVVEQLRRWANVGVSKFLFLPELDGSRRVQANNAVRGIAVLSMHVDVPSDVAEGLLRKSRQLDEVGVSTMPLLVGLTRSRPALREQAATTIRKALVSVERKLAVDATSGLQCWLHFAKSGILDAPPEELIREVGAIVETRRRVALPSALWLAEWVFVHGAKRDQDLLRVPVKEGMRSLISALRYEDSQDTDDDFDVPLLRWRCVGIARALADSGCGGETVSAWLDLAAEDPLPEVRRRVPDVAR